jgi:hypothetical protein
METMTNWLKPYGRLPATRTTTTPAIKQDFNAKLAAFKQAHGFRERHTMLCHCSRFGRAFEVVFERASDTERFAVCAVNKLAEYAGGGSSAPQQSKRFDMKQFDTTRWHCPWCSAQSWVHCPCGRNNCDARFRQRGGTLYTCEPGCGASGHIAPLTEIAASAASNAPAAAMGRAAPTLPGTGRTSLPRPNLPRLIGK